MKLKSVGRDPHTLELLEQVLLQIRVERIRRMRVPKNVLEPIPGADGARRLRTTPRRGAGGRRGVHIRGSSVHRWQDRLASRVHARATRTRLGTYTESGSGKRRSPALQTVRYIKILASERWWVARWQTPLRDVALSPTAGRRWDGDVPVCRNITGGRNLIGIRSPSGRFPDLRDLRAEILEQSRSAARVPQGPGAGIRTTGSHIRIVLLGVLRPELLIVQIEILTVAFGAVRGYPSSRVGLLHVSDDLPQLEDIDSLEPLNARHRIHRRIRLQSRITAGLPYEVVRRSEQVPLLRFSHVDRNMRPAGREPGTPNGERRRTPVSTAADRPTEAHRRRPPERRPAVPPTGDAAAAARHRPSGQPDASPPRVRTERPSAW